MTEEFIQDEQGKDLFDMGEVRRTQKAFTYAPLEPLRALLPSVALQEYESAHVEAMRSSVPYQVFGEIKTLLHEEKVDLVSPAKAMGMFGLAPEALSVAYIKGRDQHLIREIGVVGVCLPDKINLQTIMPLIVAKCLLDRGMLKKIYMALPVGAYGIAGFPRIEQYKQALGIAADIFGEAQLGEQVIPMPDYRLHLERGAIGSISSPRISDVMAKHKYPFNNLFSFTEVAGYGADIALPALVERKPVMVIADFMQYESIHAGRFASHEVGQDMSAMLLTMLSPHIQDGKMVAISHMKEAFEEDQNKCLELNPILLAGTLVMDEEETKKVYRDAVDTGKIPKEILDRVKDLQRKITFHAPLSDKKVRVIEDASVQVFNPVAEIIQEELHKRMKLMPKEARYVKGGFV